ALGPSPPPKPARPAEQFAAAVAKPAAKPAQTYEVASAASEPAPIPVGYQVASGTSKAEGAQRIASTVGRANMSANDVINERGYWQGLPSAEPADAQQVARAAPPATPRRAIASAASTPWPLTDRSDSEPMGALAYAAQPTSIPPPPALPTAPPTSPSS